MLSLMFCYCNVFQGCRKCLNVRTRFLGNFGCSGKILIDNLKIENKWKFPLTGGNFLKYQNKKINRNFERSNKTRKGGEEGKKEKKTHTEGEKTGI